MGKLIIAILVGLSCKNGSKLFKHEESAVFQDRVASSPSVLELWSLRSAPTQKDLTGPLSKGFDSQSSRTASYLRSSKNDSSSQQGPDGSSWQSCLNRFYQRVSPNGLPLQSFQHGTFSQLSPTDKHGSSLPNIQASQSSANGSPAQSNSSSPPMQSSSNNKAPSSSSQPGFRNSYSSHPSQHSSLVQSHPNSNWGSNRSTLRNRRLIISAHEKNTTATTRSSSKRKLKTKSAESQNTTASGSQTIDKSPSLFEITSNNLQRTERNSKTNVILPESPATEKKSSEESTESASGTTLKGNSDKYILASTAEPNVSLPELTSSSKQISKKLTSFEEVTGDINSSIESASKSPNMSRGDSATTLSKPDNASDNETLKPGKLRRKTSSKKKLRLKETLKSAGFSKRHAGTLAAIKALSSKLFSGFTHSTVKLGRSKEESFEVHEPFGEEKPDQKTTVKEASSEYGESISKLSSSKESKSFGNASKAPTTVSESSEVFSLNSILEGSKQDEHSDRKSKRSTEKTSLDIKPYERKSHRLVPKLESADSSLNVAKPEAFSESREALKLAEPDKASPSVSLDTDKFSNDPDTKAERPLAILEVNSKPSFESNFGLKSKGGQGLESEIFATTEPSKSLPPNSSLIITNVLSKRAKRFKSLPDTTKKLEPSSWKTKLKSDSDSGKGSSAVKLGNSETPESNLEQKNLMPFSLEPSALTTRSSLLSRVRSYFSQKKQKNPSL